jgi:hypothetical protein
MGSGKSVNVRLYQPEDKAAWDQFISKSKNGVFLFKRNYMDYHADRFHNHSLMFYRGSNLVALMPANQLGDVLQSHGGLTFGGVITGFDMTQQLMLEVFDALVGHCREIGISEVTYKPVPYIYHLVPADEDLYALFRNGAALTARQASSVIPLPPMRSFDSSRKDNLRKANKNGLIVAQSTDFETFMRMEQETLAARHGVKPVHSVEEIKLLAGCFPENIKLFGSFKDSIMVAGVVIYESQNVAHMQYAANSPKGRGIGAQDLIEDYLINRYYHGNKKYFDFGISTEQAGQLLNVGLISRKEKFGASAVMYDVYRMTP